MATESTKGLRGAVERILGADNGWFQWQWQMCHPYHIHETTRLTRSCVPLSQFPIHSSHSRGVLILCVCMWVSECTVCARESVCGGGRGDGGVFLSCMSLVNKHEDSIWWSSRQKKAQGFLLPKRSVEVLPQCGCCWQAHMPTGNEKSVGGWRWSCYRARASSMGPHLQKIVRSVSKGKPGLFNFNYGGGPTTGQASQTIVKTHKEKNKTVCLGLSKYQKSSLSIISKRVFF